MSAPDFWNDSTKAQKIAAEANGLRKKLDLMKELERKIADLPVHQELAEEDGGPAAQADFMRELRAGLAMLEQTEVQFILSQRDVRSKGFLCRTGGGGWDGGVRLGKYTDADVSEVGRAPWIQG